MGSWGAVASSGSPPRAWGRCQQGQRGRHIPRFTPTCVGTMRCTSSSSSSTAVHPHVRGDGVTWSSSSMSVLRFTPTCVGTVGRKAGTSTSRSVHPHVRGDGSSMSWYGSLWYGSPPRAWGRFILEPEELQLGRFTPTCVGTVPPCARRARPITVHPHVRGDGDRILVHQAIHGGSPPRAWGRSRASDLRSARARFTPTCVGTVALPPAQVQARSVHPHVRGDGLGIWNPGESRYGSPPRAWGRWCCRLVLAGVARFTPTCVGTVGRWDFLSCP